ncbi:hypothetical protein HYFRA_00005089 [Hymenoscyphus fraxineus]|uniref:Uncharacterized protein n=1 Tax=Hymenoscyphus fraxineus TaxID=746836 RepID=A0A9N9Q1S3_9HELO|nr:hypothetical protein HYFRA_00005089 [Hymenoscyphus fraxineus]
MSGCSTPKRPLEVDKYEEFRREVHRLDLKRYEHETSSRSASPSRSISQSLYSGASSPAISGNGPMETSTGTGKEFSEVSLKKSEPGVSLLWGTKNAQTLQVPSLHLGFGTRLRKPNTQKDEICFGMVKEIQVRILVHHHRDSNRFEGIREDEDTFTNLDLIFGQDRCEVQFQGTNIATMQKKSQRALQQLISCSKERIIFKAIVSSIELKKKMYMIMQSSVVDESHLPWSINIQIFGVRADADIVAKELSKYRLFLQHPVPRPSDAIYENPQYLNTFGSSFINGAVLPPIVVEASQKDSSHNLVSEELLDDADQVRAVINNLPKQDYLEEAIIDERIKTELRSHQKLAVDFVTGRELMEKESHRMLWHTEHLTLNSSIYRHNITGLKSKTPEDILGGILADDMGLGKTLTMIANIVSTISSAENFSAENSLGHKVSRFGRISVMSTLVIVPSIVLLNGWIEEVQKHVAPSTLRYYVYHGPDRHLTISPLPYHIVFSTYGTVAADYKCGNGVLNLFHWYRIILDEAHTIRNWSTNSFKAAESLSANIRWCMTGTPVQNSLDDLRSLVRFLRIPYLQERAIFQRYIAEKQRTVAGHPRKRPDYENLKLLLGSMCLRRSISSLSLGVIYLIKRPDLSKAEKIAYNSLAMYCKESISAVVSEQRISKGNRAILTALLRLRIFCNTGLVGLGLKGDNVDQFNPDEISSLFQQTGELPKILAPRRRLKCPECVQLNTRSKGSESSSQAYAAPAHVDTGSPSRLAYEGDGHERTSSSSNTPLGISKYPSKLKAVLSEIMKHQSEEKNIIFSFWKRSLDLIAQLLQEQGLSFRQVDGTLSPDRRQKVLAEFNQVPSVKILLMTSGTGAQGINNLSVASRLHILEPQWNPSVEDQAVGRVLRLGQEKESVRDRQLVKLQLALAGGLQSSETKKSSESQRITGLRRLNKIIEATVFTEVLTADPPISEERAG